VEHRRFDIPTIPMIGSLFEDKSFDYIVVGAGTAGMNIVKLLDFVFYLIADAERGVILNSPNLPSSCLSIQRFKCLCCGGGSRN
jgi:hypothetical protein